MEWIITFAAFFVLILFLRASAQSPGDQSYPYELREHLLSKAERLQMTSASSDSSAHESGASDVDDLERALPAGSSGKSASDLGRAKLEPQNNRLPSWVQR